MPWLTEENTYNFIVLPGGTLFFPSTAQSARFNPNFVDIFALLDNGRYNYNGLQAAIQKTFSGALQFQVAYTYAHAMSNSDEYTNGEIQSTAPTVMDRFNPRLDWSSSAFDQRHRIVVNAM